MSHELNTTDIRNLGGPVPRTKPREEKVDRRRQQKTGIGMSNETTRCKYCGRLLSVSTRFSHIRDFKHCRNQFLQEQKDKGRF